MAKFIHDFDLTFSVTSNKEDPDDIDPTVLLEACKKRLSSLKKDEIREAFGHVNVCEDNDE